MLYTEFNPFAEQLPVMHSTETIETSATKMPVSSVTDDMSTTSTSMEVIATPSPSSSIVCGKYMTLFSY